MIGVALDESVDDVREYAVDITYPVLIDRDHLLTELYAISNVPTVVWIEAGGTIARPNAAEFGTDMFAEFTGVTAEAHMNDLRAWVHDGELPADADTTIADLDDDEIQARLMFRIAVRLRRDGDDRAGAWFERAAELAPLDFTIRRAAMPLTGADPFGEEFFALYGEWRAAGSPFHGVPRST